MKWLNSHSSGADGGPRRINRAACRRQADFDREILDANTLDEQRTAGRGRRYRTREILRVIWATKFVRVRRVGSRLFPLFLSSG